MKKIFLVAPCGDMVRFALIAAIIIFLPFLFPFGGAGGGGCAALAQKIKVTESNERIGGGKNPALVVTIYDATPDEIESEWRSLMKSYKAKVSKDDGVFADNAIISSINGNNTIDVYAKTEKVKDGETKFIVAFNLGGAFLSSSMDAQWREAKKLVYDFAIKTTKEAIAGQRKAAEKQLSKLESEQKDLEKEKAKLESNIEDYKKKIEDYNKKIKEAEDAIAKNKTEQENKKKEIEAQRKVVDAVTAKEKAVE
jgi:hypothetical protein